MRRLSRCTSGRAAATLVVVAAVLVGIAMASTVTDNGGVDNGNGTTTFAYTVTAAAGEFIRDFHIRRATHPNHKVAGTPNDPDGGGTWGTGVRNSQGAHWKDTGPGIAPGGTLVFTLTVTNGKFKRRPGTWVTTSDGDNDPGTGVIDAGPVAPPAGTDTPCTVPIDAAMVSPTNSDAPIGGNTGIPLDSTEWNKAYVVYALGSVTGAPDPLDDPDGFVTYASSHQVPTEWGLTFAGMSGTTDGSGQSTAPTVTVPNNAALVGNTFYLVALVDSDEEAGEKITDWPAKEMTITDAE